MYNDWGADRAAIKTIKIFFFSNLLIFQSLDSTSIPKSIFNKRFFIRSNVEHKRFSHNARKQETERERERFTREPLLMASNIGPGTPSSVPDPPRSSAILRPPLPTVHDTISQDESVGAASGSGRTATTRPRLVVFPREDRRASASFHVSDTRHPRNSEPSIRVCRSSIGKSAIGQRNLAESRLDNL